MYDRKNGYFSSGAVELLILNKILKHLYAKQRVRISLPEFRQICSFYHLNKSEARLILFRLKQLDLIEITRQNLILKKKWVIV